MVSTRRSRSKEQVDGEASDGGAVQTNPTKDDADSQPTRITRARTRSGSREKATVQESSEKKPLSSESILDGSEAANGGGSSSADAWLDKTLNEDQPDDGECEHDTIRLPLPATQHEKHQHGSSKPHQSKGSSATVGHSTEIGNGLTQLIPGYVAPLKLTASSLDRYRPKGGIAELRSQAERTDASTSKFVVETTVGQANAMKRSPNGFMPPTYAPMYSSFKTGTKPAPDLSAGKGWFGMMPTPLTDEVKTDLAVIRNRNYLDPKRFYKSADSTKGKVLQVGTVIEGAAEFHSARLTKKQRRGNLTEEIMADPAASAYTKNKYRSMQQAKTEQYRKFHKRKNPRKARRGF
jgi:hypothetical protein